MNMYVNGSTYNLPDSYKILILKLSQETSGFIPSLTALCTLESVLNGGHLQSSLFSTDTIGTTATSDCIKKCTTA